MIDPETVARIVNFLTGVGLFALMLATGLRSTWKEVLASLRDIRLAGRSLAANFVIVPAIASGLLWAFQTEPLVAVGFLILAACPGAPVSPPMTALARGDVPLAIGQMVLLAGLSAVLSPALLGLLLRQAPGDHGLSINSLAIIGTLLVAQALPLAIGLSVRQFSPASADWWSRSVGRIANIVLLAVVVLLLWRERGTMAATPARAWFGMLLWLALSLVVGWLMGGPARPARIALALTTGVRNAAVGLVIVNSSFPGTAAVNAVVSFALVSIVGGLLFAVALAVLTSDRGIPARGVPVSEEPAR
ncbi:MAG: bile acid:sodium symporter [Planctomyces sp.]|nr:bile acid:sodium symporter [Planctomyces sp.]